MPNFIKICLLGAKLFHGDGQTDIHDKANTCFSEFCKYKWQEYGLDYLICSVVFYQACGLK
jgi:hypothetical protein